VGEQREHGGLEALHDKHHAPAVLAPAPEVRNQGRQSPPSSRREQRDPRRAEDAGGDGAVTAVQLPDGRLEAVACTHEPEERANDRDGRRGRWQRVVDAADFVGSGRLLGLE